MRVALLGLALLLAGCAAPGEAPSLPDSIAVLGDSISRATNAKGERFAEFPAHAWATGSDPADGVDSHYERLRGLDPALDIVPFNDARSGARADDLARQAEEAATQRAQHVVVLIGANDACASPPTPRATFAAQVEAAAAVLDGLGASVLVASVPNVAQLARLHGDNPTARAVWDAFDVCPRILGPGADLEEAERGIRGYNEELARIADAHGWAWDGGAVFDSVYEAGDVSSLDFFHPSLAGQAKLAEVTWGASPYAAASSSER